ncbi:hypothetical protein D3C80_1254660 [compost metagenome]
MTSGTSGACQLRVEKVVLCAPGVRDIDENSVSIAACTACGVEPLTKSGEMPPGAAAPKPAKAPAEASGGSVPAMPAISRAVPTKTVSVPALRSAEGAATKRIVWFGIWVLSASACERRRRESANAGLASAGATISIDVIAFPSGPVA